MNTYSKAHPSPEGQRQLESLRRAVDKALERKRRLGQYAVIWQDGRPARLEPPDPAAKPSA